MTPIVFPDVLEPPLQVGDRVARPRSLGEPGSLRVGRIIAVYRSTPNGQGQAHTMYDVEWQNGERRDGYLEGGLTRVPPVLATP